MKMDLPILVVVEITFNAAQRLAGAGRESRAHAARAIRDFIGGAPDAQRHILKANFKDAVAHYRRMGMFR